MPPLLAGVPACLCSPLFPSFFSREPLLHRATGSLWSSFVWNRKQCSCRQMQTCRCRAWQADGAFEYPGKSNNNPSLWHCPAAVARDWRSRPQVPSGSHMPLSRAHCHNGYVARPYTYPTAGAGSPAFCVPAARLWNS